jgi:hypothetical protein
VGFVARIKAFTSLGVIVFIVTGLVKVVTKCPVIQAYTRRFRGDAGKRNKKEIPLANINGCTPAHRVWEFRNETQTWITWHVGYDPPTPAAGSAAALADLQVCHELAPASMLDRAGAIALAALLRSIRRKEGLKVLAGRVYRGAGEHPRPCLGYRSIRAAAAATGLSRRQICRLCGFPGYSGRRGGKIDTDCQNGTP